MHNPVKTKKLVITSPFGRRWDFVNKQWIMHYGIDLRCYDFKNKKFLPFQATENSIVLRIKRDRNDNGIVVLKPLQSNGYKELKYIHIAIESCSLFEGQEIKAGHLLGWSEIRGQSNSHHLHFETINNDGVKINPQIYIDKYLL